MGSICSGGQRCAGPALAASLSSEQEGSSGQPTIEADLALSTWMLHRCTPAIQLRRRTNGGTVAARARTRVRGRRGAREERIAGSRR